MNSLEFKIEVQKDKELPYMFELDGQANQCKLEFVLPKKYFKFKDESDCVTLTQKFFDEYSGIVRASSDLWSNSTDMVLSSKFSGTSGNPVVLYRPWFPWQQCKLKSSQKIETYPQNGWLRSIWICLTQYKIKVTVTGSWEGIGHD